MSSDVDDNEDEDEDENGARLVARTRFAARTWRFERRTVKAFLFGSSAVSCARVSHSTGIQGTRAFHVCGLGLRAHKTITRGRVRVASGSFRAAQIGASKRLQLGKIVDVFRVPHVFGVFVKMLPHSIPEFNEMLRRCSSRFHPHEHADPMNEQREAFVLLWTLAKNPPAH